MPGWEQETEPSAFSPSLVTQAVLIWIPAVSLPRTAPPPPPRPNLTIPCFVSLMFVITWSGGAASSGQAEFPAICSLSKDDDLLCTAVAEVSYGYVCMGVSSYTELG